MADEFLVLSADRSRPAGLFSVKTVLPGGDPVYDNLYDARRRLPPGVVRLIDTSSKGRFRKARGTSRLKAVIPRYGTWAFRKSLIEPLFKDVPPTVATLYPARLEDAEGILDEDWVFLEIHAVFPVDRDACAAVYAAADNPHGSRIVSVQEFRWGEGRTPKDPLFRVGEFPNVAMIRGDWAERLSQATGKIVLGLRAPYPSGEAYSALLEPNFVTRWTPRTDLEPDVFMDDSGTARRAAEAFWRMVQGDQTDRQVALASPLYALWTALIVDRAGREETRQAAGKVPFFALLYERDVDRVIPEEVPVPGPVQPQAMKPEVVAIERRPLPEKLSSRYADSEAAPEGGRYRHEAFDDELRSDMEHLLKQGFGLIERSPEGAPEEIVEAVHERISLVQQGKQKVGPKQRAALACVFGEQLVRAVRWQWARVDYGSSKPAGLISPDRARAHFPLALITRLARKGRSENTIALLFNMLREGVVPEAEPWSYTPVE